MKDIRVSNPRLQRVLDSIKPRHIVIAWVIALILAYIAYRV